MYLQVPSWDWLMAGTVKIKGCGEGKQEEIEEKERTKKKKSLCSGKEVKKYLGT